MGNDIDSGPARSVVYVHQTDLDNNFSNTSSLFQLESKSYRTKQCWSYISYHVEFFFGLFFLYKNLHIEPFCYNPIIKSPLYYRFLLLSCPHWLSSKQNKRFLPELMSLPINDLPYTRPKDQTPLIDCLGEKEAWRPTHFS